jgi:hypothetical protein
VDKSLANAHKGVYTFRVNGTIHHKIGTLTHNIDEEPKFAQIYFHDQAYQIKRRGKIFLNANLSPNIIRDIQNMLYTINPYVQKYRHASEFLKSDPTLDLQIVLFQDEKADKRRFNTPTADEVAAIVIGSNEQRINYSREIRLYKKSSDNNILQIISDDHSALDPLSYPILHPYGDQGWAYRLYRKFAISKSKNTENNNEKISEIDSNILNNQGHDEISEEENENSIEERETRSIELNDAEQINETNENLSNLDDDETERLSDSGVSSQSKWVSCCEFYKNRLMLFHDSYFHLCGRLLQQYIVDNYLKVENQKLKYFMFNQDSLRTELYKGLLYYIINIYII